MSRKRFEQQFKGMPYCLSMQKDAEGDYVSYGTKMAWEGWIAAAHNAQFEVEEVLTALNTKLDPE